MNSFFHIDRSLCLQEGQIINLNKFSDNIPEKLQSHVNLLFPKGISSHGRTYIVSEIFNCDHCTVTRSVNIIEYLFEYVRKSYYPQNPSRFQSVFAFDNIELAKDFRNIFCKSQGNICEIESKVSFKADMNLLTLGNSLLEADYYAHLYWKGEPTGNPFWEYLLVPPVKVIRKVDG